MTLAEAKKIAKEHDQYIGKLTAEKDSQGEYNVYNDGMYISSSYSANATEAKIGAVLYVCGINY